MSFNKLAVNTLWNLAGQLLPLIVAIIALPALIRSLGIDRYGFLSLALVLIGYAGLFDFGIGRAMTRLVAQKLAEHDLAGARRIGAVATTYMLLLGILSGVALCVFSRNIVSQWLVIPVALQSEAINAMWLLAASLPFVLLTAAYRGAIEAHQHFKPLNMVRIFMGTSAPFVPRLCPRDLKW
jgi:O-antigen/teichoic acid export membrane protein